MPTYTEMAVLAASPPLLSRFVVAVERAAFDILNEDPQTANHAQRLAFARKILWDDGGAQRWARRALRLAVVSNATLQTEGEAIDDAGVQFIVNSLLTTLPQTE